MLFQKFCQKYPLVKVGISTALSCEEAIRATHEQHFHIITMDQTLSTDYCNRCYKFQFDFQLCLENEELALTEEFQGGFLSMCFYAGAQCALQGI